MLRPEFIPPLRRRKFAPLVLATAGLCLIGLRGTYAGTPDDDLRKLRAELAASASRQENFSTELDNLSDEIKAIKQKLVVAGRGLTGLDQRLVDVDQKLQEIHEVEQETLDDLSNRNSELANTLSALVNLSRQPEGTLIGNPAGLVDSLRASALLQSILPKLKEDANHLSRQLETLASLRKQYAAQQAEDKSLREQRLSEQNELDQLLLAKKTAQEKITQASKSEEVRNDKLTADVRDLTALIDRLEVEKAREKAEREARLAREIAAREEAKREAKEKAKALAEAAKSVPVPHAAPKETRTAALAPRLTLPSAHHFANAKGTLPLPVGGHIIAGFNEAQSASEKQGIVIESRANAAVISPFDGQIAFAGPFRHYGLLVIIDHGDGYHTLLAGLGSIDGTVGQLLLAGEPVGQMKSGGNEKPKLYMELRNNGSPINPVPWLAASNRKVSG